MPDVIQFRTSERPLMPLIDDERARQDADAIRAIANVLVKTKRLHATDATYTATRLVRALDARVALLAEWNGAQRVFRILSGSDEDLHAQPFAMQARMLTVAREALCGATAVYEDVIAPTWRHTLTKAVSDFQAYWRGRRAAWASQETGRVS